MTTPPSIPRAVAGDRLTQEQSYAISKFLKAHPSRRIVGLLFTAKFANECIDWFNTSGRFL